MAFQQPISEIIKFYRNCYREELMSSAQFHLHASKVIRRYFFDGKEELINEEYPKIPISEKDAVEFLATLKLRGNEIELIYYSGFGLEVKKGIDEKLHSYIQPLFSFNCEIQKEKDYFFLTVDIHSRKPVKTSFSNKLLTSLPFVKANVIEGNDLGFWGKVASAINIYNNDESANRLLDFPQLTSVKEIKQHFRKRKEVHCEYRPGACLAIVEKDKSNFSIQDELDSLVNTDEYSSAIKVLFQQKLNEAKHYPGLHVSSLNKDQIKALENSNQHILSLISGPPGTGKSFTTANIAIEKISKGESVIVVAANEEALNVIEEKITHQLGLKDLVVNVSRDPNRKTLKETLSRILKSKPSYMVDFKEVEKAYSKIDLLQMDLRTKEKELQNKFNLEKIYFEQLSNKILGKGKSKNYFDRIIYARSLNTYPLWDELEEYYFLLEKIHQAIIDGLNLMREASVVDNVVKNKEMIRMYAQFIRTRQLERKTELLGKINFRPILNLFPIWLVKIQDVSLAVPAVKEMFDYAILDEATQCNTASVLPVLQRGKNAVIVGDSNQLKHISFLPKHTESTHRGRVQSEYRHLCQYRDLSILELLEETIDLEARVQLNEHFRSQYPIISFSNFKIYNNTLEILSKRPVAVNDAVNFNAIKGNEKNGVNEEEVKAILNRIRTLINAQTNLDETLKTSIGILSPYRDQVNRFINQVGELFSLEEIEKHKILVGTAYTFQGNERDIMYLSMRVTDKSPSGSFNYLNRRDVFNVSVTRARTRQEIFYSFTPEKINANSLVRHFFEFYEKLSIKREVIVAKDAFCREVVSFLKVLGCTSWEKYSYAGVSLDILVKTQEHYFAIDLIGFPGEMEDYYQLERYITVQRGKIKIYPLPYALWLGNRTVCENFLKKMISG